MIHSLRVFSAVHYRPVKQIVPIQRLANFVGEHEIVRLPELRVLRPYPLQGLQNGRTRSNGTSRLSTASAMAAHALRLLLFPIAGNLHPLR
jgi:hypothetical protein